MIEDQAPPMLRPTVMAGISTGLLTAVPFIGGILLMACCSPVIGCGFLAAYWYSRDCRQAGIEFTPTLGRTVGLISGAFWAATVTVLVVVTWPGIDAATEQVEKIWESMGQTDPKLLDELDRLRDFYAETSGFMLVLLVFFIYLLIAALLSTLGGMLGGAVFRDRGSSG
jgi:hypothetical protein